VFIGATIESETTSATLGKEGVRAFSPMANIDFLVVPLGTYIRNHLRFGEKLDNPPLIFATNYFLKEKGKFLNHKVDKKVWLLWMEGRVHHEYDAIETPVGYIPKYEDLKTLFKQVFDKEYTKADYDVQFAIRTSNWIEKMERMEQIYADEDNVPGEFLTILKEEKERLEKAKAKYGKDIIPPDDFL
jgi:phosphoenolpyruvate carboxykinase (GTP)